MEHYIQSIVDALSSHKGIEAIVLGGSRATQTHDADSDIDIGVYYTDALDFDALEHTLKSLDDDHRDQLLARPGAWGKWVNGGAWLSMNGKPVDIILRELNRVSYYLDQVKRGQLTAHYQTGHPHAYFNAMYVGELALCQVLISKTSTFTKMKEDAQHYPSALKESILNWFQFEAQFSLDLAVKAIPRDDAYYVNAHVIRSISAINQVLFAMNETYCINEKHAVRIIDGFMIKPDNYKKRVDEIMMTMGSNPDDACRLLSSLIQETQSL